MKMRCFPALFAVILSLCLPACNSSGGRGDDPYFSEQTSPEINDWLVVHQLVEPDMLLPTHYSTVSADMLCTNMIFQSLMMFDPQTLNPVPVLAEGRPIISEDGLKFTFTIRKNASWDNGSPVTAEDYISTLKIIRNPAVNTRLSLYVDFISDVVPDPTNPKKFTIITKSPGVNNEMHMSDILVLPKYIYDPKGIMDKFSLKQLDTEKEKLANDPDLQAFAKEYLSDKHKREKEFVSGSGPYALGEWVTGQQVNLERKNNWWGDKEQSTEFQAWPQRLVFRTISDMNTAVMELKAQRLDLMFAIRPNVFRELEKNPDVNKHFQLMKSDMFGFSFLGMNMKPGKKRKQFFTDARVRKAMTHLLDVEKAINQFVFGYARRINGPVPYLKKDEYNTDIPFAKFDIDEARRLLKEAGWEDTNGNGTVDKVIDGKRTEFEFEFAYGQNVEVRKNIGLMFAEDARKAGVKVNVTGYDNPVIQEKMAAHDLDMLYFTLSTGPGPTDLKEQFHTESWLSGGFNFMGFGTPETDKLIEDMANEMNASKRSAMMKKIQEIIYAETPCIFLLSSQNLFAVSRRIQNVQTTVIRPNFLLSRMWVPKDLSRYADK